MKIAVVHNLPPGGQKRALYNQVKLLSRNHLIDLYTPSSTDDSFCNLKSFAKKHFSAYYYQPKHFPYSIYSIYFSLPKAYKKLSKEIHDSDYDVVYVNPCYLTQAPYILSYLKVPTLYYCPEPKREFYERIVRSTKKWTYLATYPFRIPIKYIDFRNTQKATKIVTNSIYSQKQIEKIYRIKSNVNYLGVDTSVFKPAKIKKTNMVITVGEFSLFKGHDFIIKSLSLIKRSIRPRLTIVGTQGVDKKYLFESARKNNIKLNICQGISDKELVNLLNRAKIFLYAAYKEPFGLSILEAMSCGLPVVAVNEGGVEEMLENSSFGYLINRNEVKFANLIKKILLQKRGFEQQKNQHEFMKKKWNWEKSVSRLENYLKEIAK